MATYTTHFNLDKYEGSDRPNLRDQYNAAMDKIDGQLYSEAQSIESHTNSITALQAAQIAANARMDNQDISIDGAVNDANQAITVAQDTQEQLGGNSIILVNPSNFSEYFSYPSDTIVDRSKPVQFDAILIGTATSRKALITFTFTTRAITTSDYNRYLHAFNINGWKSANQESHQWLIFEYGSDFHVSTIFPAASSATPSMVSISMTPTGSALPNGLQLTATIMVDLIPA